MNSARSANKQAVIVRIIAIVHGPEVEGSTTAGYSAKAPQSIYVNANTHRDIQPG
jgi:hypothetical protein